MEVWTLEKEHAICKCFSGIESREEANAYFTKKHKEGLPIITRSYDYVEPFNEYYDWEVRNSKIRLWNTKIEDWFLPMIDKDICGDEDDVPGYVLAYVYKIADMRSLYSEKVDELEFTFRGQTIKVITEFHHGDYDPMGKHEDIIFIKDGKVMSYFSETR